jgi:hypothetical protein
MLLNLARSEDYNLLPSCSYEESENSKKAEMSYYEMKELKKSFNESGVDSYALLVGNDFMNDYGNIQLALQNRD